MRSTPRRTVRRSIPGSFWSGTRCRSPEPVAQARPYQRDAIRQLAPIRRARRGGAAGGAGKTVVAFQALAEVPVGRS
jgi:superfamily II DNA or RNA helicase